MKRLLCALSAALIIFFTTDASYSSVSRTLTVRERELVARLVAAETAGEPFICKTALAALVLNRVNDSRFPDTVYDVVWEAGAFLSADKGFIAEAPNKADYNAALYAVNCAEAGLDPADGSVFFYRKSDSSAESIYVILSAGNMIFGK